MALQFTTTDRITQDAGIKVMVYGGAGVGKTVLCSTAPTPIILSAEAGLLSLASVSIPVIVISTMADLGEIYRWLTESHEAKPFETICLDSISEIAEKVLVNSKALAKDPRQAYGDMAEKLIALVKAYRDIQNKNVYFSAKMEKDKDELTGMTLWQPSAPGKQISSQLPYLFDEVFRMGAAKDQQNVEYRFLQTQPDMQYVAKDRSGKLASIEPPNLTTIFNKIKGK
jgi:hypothetical protein